MEESALGAEINIVNSYKSFVVDCVTSDNTCNTIKLSEIENIFIKDEVTLLAKDIICLHDQASNNDLTVQDKQLDIITENLKATLIQIPTDTSTNAVVKVDEVTRGLIAEREIFTPKKKDLGMKQIDIIESELLTHYDAKMKEIYLEKDLDKDKIEDFDNQFEPCEFVDHALLDARLSIKKLKHEVGYDACGKMFFGKHTGKTGKPSNQNGIP